MGVAAGELGRRPPWGALPPAIFAPARLALTLAAGLLIAWLASRTPSPAPTDASAGRFSAGRAMQDIGRMATVPHPTGSAANARVRDQLAARLAGLGLPPRIQRQSGLRPWGETTTRTYAVENVIGRLPGTDASAPALLLMSHYDSVPGSPGAADDMAGVAVELEIARLLKQGPRPVRDVIFLFTDGEEPGLLGAQAFFTDAAVSRHIGFVLNMESRGGGGRAEMFQTAPREAGGERLFAAHPGGPASASLAAYVYSHMPNDTDFSIALAHGRPGLNYAFTGRPELYHTPAAIPARVEPGAVQSLGDQVWAVARTLAATPELPRPGPDLVWFDLLGQTVIAYPPVVGWAPLALAAALLGFAVWRQVRDGRLDPVAIGGGAGRSLAALLIAGGGLFIYGRLAVHGYYQGLGQAGQTEGWTAAILLASSLLAFRAGGPTRSPLACWTGAVLPCWGLGLVLQILAPQTAFIFAWPAVVAALALAGTSARPHAGKFIAAGLGALGLGAVMETWHMLIIGVGLVLPAASVAFLPAALALLTPLLQTDAPPQPGSDFAV